MVNRPPPVITIDGPGGTGKGTISKLIANALGWHYLDSGALYRILAYAAIKAGIDLTHESALEKLAHGLPVEFNQINSHLQVILAEQDVTDAIRDEQCGNAASKIASLPKVREALLERQRAFCSPPGLVTDGRDMGTVVFPDAKLKFYLQASLEERAKRRFNQLKLQGIHASLDEILQDLIQRDTRDKQRGAAPLKPAPEAILIDTTDLTIEQVFTRIMQKIESMFCLN